MDEQIKSKTGLCRSIFLRERYAVQLHQKAGRMVAGDVEFCFFALRNERFKQIDIKT